MRRIRSIAREPAVFAPRLHPAVEDERARSRGVTHGRQRVGIEEIVVAVHTRGLEWRFGAARGMLGMPAPPARVPYLEVDVDTGLVAVHRHIHATFAIQLRKPCARPYLLRCGREAVEHRDRSRDVRR